MNTTTQKILRDVLAALRRRWDSIRDKLRCHARPPSGLEWIHDTVRYLRAGSPPEARFASLVDLQKEDKEDDKTARTFALLTEYGEWLDRVEAGIAKHQAEMDRQVQEKITRVKMHGALGKKIDVPS